MFRHPVKTTTWGVVVESPVEGQIVLSVLGSTDGSRNGKCYICVLSVYLSIMSMVNRKRPEFLFCEVLHQWISVLVKKSSIKATSRPTTRIRPGPINDYKRPEGVFSHWSTVDLPDLIRLRIQRSERRRSESTGLSDRVRISVLWFSPLPTPRRSVDPRGRDFKSQGRCVR